MRVFELNGMKNILTKYLRINNHTLYYERVICHHLLNDNYLHCPIDIGGILYDGLKKEIL